MTWSPVAALPALLLWLVVAYRLPAVRRQARSPTVRAVWLTALFLALAATLVWPPVYVTVSRVTGVPNVARLLGNSFVLVAGWCTLSLLYHLSFAQAQAQVRIRRFGHALGAALILMAVLFLLAASSGEDAFDYGRRANAPFVLEYRLVYLASVAVCIVVVARLCWRYAGLTTLPNLSVGLRLVAASGVAGIAYVVHDGLFSLYTRLGWTYPLPAPWLLTEVFIALAIALLVAGATMPAWGSRAGVPALYYWTRRWTAYHRLRPLWRALYRANPQIALLPARAAVPDLLDVRNVRFRLYRQVIEIWDGRLALRPYLRPGVERHAARLALAAGLSDAEARPLVEAAVIAAALQAQEHDRSASETAILVSPPAAAADVDGDAAFLGEVARHLIRAPLVRTVTAWAALAAQGPDAEPPSRKRLARRRAHDPAELRGMHLRVVAGPADDAAGPSVGVAARQQALP